MCMCAGSGHVQCITRTHTQCTETYCHPLPPSPLSRPHKTFSNVCIYARFCRVYRVLYIVYTHAAARIGSAGIMENAFSMDCQSHTLTHTDPRCLMHVWPAPAVCVPRIKLSDTAIFFFFYILHNAVCVAFIHIIRILYIKARVTPSGPLYCRTICV